MRSSTLDSLHTWVSPGSIGCEYTYSGPFREAQISEQPLWGFSSSNPDRSQSRDEQGSSIKKDITHISFDFEETRPRDEYFLKDHNIKSEFSKFVLKSFNILFCFVVVENVLLLLWKSLIFLKILSVNKA